MSVYVTLFDIIILRNIFYLQQIVGVHVCNVRKRSGQCCCVYVCVCAFVYAVSCSRKELLLSGLHVTCMYIICVYIISYWEFCCVNCSSYYIYACNLICPYVCVCTVYTSMYTHIDSVVGCGSSVLRNTRFIYNLVK